MIKFDDIIALIQRSKTPYVCISDLHGNKIVEFANSNVSTTITELQEVEGMLRMYGKLEVRATTAEGHKGNYKGAYKWILIFDKPAADISGQNKIQPWQMGAAPPGFVHGSEMMFKLKELELKMDHDKKIRELELKMKVDEDPVKKYGEFIPVIMSFLGKSDEQIEKFIKWQMMGKGFNSGASMAGVTNTLTFKDVEKLTQDQKNEKIEALLSQILAKVNCDKLRILLEAFNDRPELAVKAVNALPLLTMGDPVIEKHSATPEQLTKLNGVLDQLPAKVSAEHMILLFEAVNKNPELVEKAINYLPLL